MSELAIPHRHGRYVHEHPHGEPHRLRGRAHRHPLGIAFFLRSARGEKLAGLAVVLAIFVSACIALYETIQRLFNPQDLTHLWVLAAAGAIGFVGNEIAAQVRLRAGRRLDRRSAQTGTMPASTASSHSE